MKGVIMQSARMRAYQSWYHMLDRCTNPKAGNFGYYGGRGIAVCDRWAGSFEKFLADMGTRPDGHCLDRIDPEGNYEPGNCRWAPLADRARNTRVAHPIEFGGDTLTLEQWAKRIGISRPALIQRLKTWPLERALSMSAQAKGGRRPKVQSS